MESFATPRYPASGSSTEIHDNSASGFSLTTSTARSLMAEMIREGASGGIANVDEPWTNYVGQPQYMFPDYAQGYTWGESAYMGLPGIGWQEVALGDPLMAPYAVPPSVSFTSPAADGQAFSGVVTFDVTAKPVGSAGISSVEFWLDDDTLLATDTSAPYACNLDISALGLADGVHTLEAVAYGNDAVQSAGSASRVIIANRSHTACPKVTDVISNTDGTQVLIQGKVVSAIFGGTFYIEETDRTGALRVRSTSAVSEGSLVTVTGTLQTVDGEREILADMVYATN